MTPNIHFSVTWGAILENGGELHKFLLLLILKVRIPFFPLFCLNSLPLALHPLDNQHPTDESHDSHICLGRLTESSSQESARQEPFLWTPRLPVHYKNKTNGLPAQKFLSSLFTNPHKFQNRLIPGQHFWHQYAKSRHKKEFPDAFSMCTFYEKNNSFDSPASEKWIMRQEKVVDLFFFSCFRAGKQSQTVTSKAHQQKGSISLGCISYCSKTPWNVSNTIMHFGKDLLSGLTRVGKGWNGHLQDVRCPLHPALLQGPGLSHSDQPSADLELRPRRERRVERKHGGDGYFGEKKRLWRIYGLFFPLLEMKWNWCPLPPNYVEPVLFLGFDWLKHNKKFSLKREYRYLHILDALVYKKIP